MPSPRTARSAIALTAVLGTGVVLVGIDHQTAISSEPTHRPTTAASASTTPTVAARALQVAAEVRTPAATTVSRSVARAALSGSTPAATKTAKPVAKKAAAKPVVKAAVKKQAKDAKDQAKVVASAATPTTDLSASQLKLVQAELTAAGHEVPTTGHFGPMTQQAIRDFQASKGLELTGAPGPRTRALLAQHEARARQILGQSDASSTGSSSSSNDATSQAPAASSTTSSAAQAAVDFAYAQLGKPYVYGATGPNAYDCSGLTSSAWRAAGVSIPRTSSAQMSSLTRVSLGTIRPGDIVVYYGGSHVGIYVGDGMIIHAPRPGKSVEKVSINRMPVTSVVRPG